MVAEAERITRPAVETGWERATARVLDHVGRPAGAAFLMPGKLVLTCAHVLSGVFGMPPDQPLPAGAEVMIDFPLAAQRPKIPAHVQFSLPVAADSTGDIAVLRLAGSEPPDAAPLRVIAADDLAGHRWRAFGFPWYGDLGEAKDAGIWTSGTIRGREGTGWWQLAVDPEEAFSLAGGFSGAAVWDDTYAGVVGVIVAVESDPGRRTGYALTVETVAGQWPELRTHLLAGCPYRALRPFTELDGGVFFGRDTETDRLAELVTEESRAIVPVLGPSGVGKSSLVGAGLLARLAAAGGYLTAHVPHGVRYDASQLLAWALASAGRDDRHGAAWQTEWRALAAGIASEGGPAGAASQVLAAYPETTRLLIIVDQFEAMVSAEPEVARDLDTMLGVLTRRWPDGTRRVQAVVVMRIDFLSQLEAFPNITEAWKTTNVVVPPMTREQLRQVINAPLADLKGIRFAAGLADQILHDTPTGPAALPMLEYTLTELWKQQQRGVITTAAYRELGGVDGALARSAERALWERADASELPAAERVLIQMVRPGEQLDAGGRAPDTRRVANRDEFDSAQWGLIHRLASARLVVITRQPAGPDTAELAHEALLDAWPRLADWVNANREFRTWQEGLRRARRQWQDHGQDARFLLDEPRIAEAREWEERRAEDLTSSERDFIAASITMAGRRRRHRRSLFGAAALAVIAAAAASVLAFQQHVNGDIQHDNSQSQQIVSEAAGLDASQPNLAKQLQIAAYQLAHTSQAYSSLFSGEGLPGSIAVPGATSAVYSQRGNLLAVSAGQQVRLWDTATHRFLSAVPASGGATWAAFNSASTLLAVAEGNGTIQIWDLAQPGRPAFDASVTGSVGPVSQVAFSPGADLLGSAGWDHTVRLWNLSDPAHPAALATIQAGTKIAAAIAFSPDGHLLATADWDGFVRLWDVTSPSRPALLAAIDNRQVVRSVAISAVGDVLAVAGDNIAGDDDLHLWGIGNPRKPRLLAGIASGQPSIAAVAFSPTAPLLAATGPSPGTTYLWNIADPERPAALPALNGGSLCLAFSPDGQTLATLDQDQAVRATREPDDEVELWSVADPTTPAALATVKIPSGPVADSVALSPDARVLAVADAADIASHLYAQLWDLSDAQRPAALWNLPAAGSTAALALDGHHLLLAVGGSGFSGDGLVSLWDVTDSAHPAWITNFPIGRAGDTEPDIDVAFSPDGTVLAALAPGDSVIWRWSLRDLSHILPLPRLTGAPYGLISVGLDGQVVTDTLDEEPEGSLSQTAIWDLRRSPGPRPLAHLPQLVSGATATAVDPAAPILATGDANGAVQLWSLSRPGQLSLLTTLPGTTAPQNTLSFSPDGRTLASDDANSNIHLWNISDPQKPTVVGAFPAPQNSMLLGVSLPVSASGSQFAETVVGGPDDNGYISLWEINAGRLIGRLCAGTGDTITAAQWNQYVPGQPYRPPCQASG
jgi:WD40 repeat protein